MPDLKTRLERLEKQAEQLDAQIKLERAKIRKQEKKDDDRRKILIGAMVLTQHGGSWVPIKQQLDEYLTRAHDRKLFGLS